jgi:hypothetical protein
MSRLGHGSFFWKWKEPYIGAHRASWLLLCGPIPEGMFVLHKCDVAGCVNPSHLYLGTQLENMRDRRDRNRMNSPQGERSGSAKLTEEQVKYIRSSPKSNAELAKELGVWHPAISKIRLRQRWKHI